MTRPLSSTDAAEVASQVVAPRQFLKIAFPFGTVYLTDSDRQHTVNGDTYTPDGRFGSVGNYAEGSDLKPRAAGIQLSGVDPTLVQGLVANPSSAWVQIAYTLGFADVHGDLLDAPTFSAGLYLGDAMIILNQNSGAITISGENVFADMQGRKSGVIAGSQDQQLRAPGDTFFNMLPTLINKTIYWGGKSPVGIGISGGGPSPGTGSFGFDIPGIPTTPTRTY